MKKSNENLAELASKECPYCKSADINLGRVGNPIFTKSGYTISTCNRCESMWQLVYSNDIYTNLYLTKDNWNINVCKFCGVVNGEYSEWTQSVHLDICEVSDEKAIYVPKEEFINKHHYKNVCRYCGEEHGAYCEDFEIDTEWGKKWVLNEGK